MTRKPSKYCLSIRWANSTETIDGLDFAKPPSKGDWLRTTEFWTHDHEPVRYEARVVYTKEDEAYLNMQIHYVPDRIWGKPGFDYEVGTSDILINKKRLTAKARWCTKGSAEFSGFMRGRIEIVEAERDTERTAVSRITRPTQRALREHLLRIDGKCALTGTTTAAALQVAHIVDVQRKGADVSTNAILLRADLHLLFDQRLFSIDATSGKLKLADTASRLVQDKSYKMLKKAKIDETLLKRVEGKLKIRNAPST